MHVHPRRNIPRNNIKKVKIKNVNVGRDFMSSYLSIYSTVRNFDYFITTSYVFIDIRNFDYFITTSTIRQEFLRIWPLRKNSCVEYAKG